MQIRLHEEHERSLLYLDASTRKPLIATAERQLLERHISAILDKVVIMVSFFNSLFSHLLAGSPLLKLLLSLLMVFLFCLGFHDADGWES